MNKVRKNISFCKARGLLLALYLCTVLASCAPIQEKIKEYAGDKEQCFLSDEDITRFTYKGSDYTILEDTFSKGRLGEWIGYIRQFAAVDEKGKILAKENMAEVTVETLTKLKDQASHVRYVIPFFNVYAAKGDASYLIVDVNGGYHKAVLSQKLTDADTVFDFRTGEEQIGGSYELNPGNATQIICGGVIYQVTSEKVPKEQLGKYLDVLAQKVTFDADTKIPLTKEELDKIDWFGNSSKQRENRMYGEVYEILGTDTKEAVAVKVNNQYYVARVK